MKETQGHKKMVLYIKDLIRNKKFLRLTKRLIREKKKNGYLGRRYEDWTEEQKKDHDRINRELKSIINEYESLRKRCQKLLKDKSFRIKERMASEYGLDGYLAELAIAMHKKDTERMDIITKTMVEPDMCQIIDLYDEIISPTIKGDEIIYLRNDLELMMNAYPIAIMINQNSTRNDIIDYVKKKWPFIEMNLRNFDNQKGLKIRERKISHDIVDFIWKNQGLKSKQIISKLDDKFPSHGLAYYEVNKIIQIEKERRFKTWFE